MAAKKYKNKKRSKKDSKPIQTKRAPHSFWRKPQNYIPIFVILLLTLIVYGQTFGYDFVYWDDDVNILKNENVNSFFWSNFWAQTRDIFTSQVIGNYNPLPILTFGIENAMYGIDKPGNFHIINVLLHLICTLLVYRIGSKLELKSLGASILAFLFALHPMHVESVAWITERKDVLYGVFFLGATLQYLKYKESQRKSHLWWMTILFILSLFSKIQAVSFPLVLILIDIYQGKSLNVKTILDKWPYLLLSLTTGILGIFFLQDQGSLDTSDTFSFVERLFIGAYSLVGYLVKSIVPFKLSPLYPYPPALSWEYYASIIVFPLIIIGLYYSYLKNKVLFFGIGFFLANIVFLLQILGAGQGLLADRFTYIAYLGLFFIIAFYLEKYVGISVYKNIILGITAIAGLLYAGMTYRQIQVWENSETLWSKVLTYYQNSTLPYGNRANYYRDQGRYNLALQDYNKTLSMKADQPAALNSRAKLFFTVGKSRDTLLLALNDYNLALELDPKNPEYLTNRGATYARLGDYNQAFGDINKALEVNPGHLAAISNRFVMNAQTNKWQQALQDVNLYLSYEPYNVDFIYEKANINMILGNYGSEVLSNLDKAISMQPNRGIFYYRKCEYLFKTNRPQEAKQFCNQALQLGYNNFSQEVRQRLQQ